MKGTFDRSRLLTIALPAILFIAGISVTCSASGQTQDWEKELGRDVAQVAKNQKGVDPYQTGLDEKFNYSPSAASQYRTDQIRRSYL